MVQWVKDTTTVAWVAAEKQVQSLAQSSGLRIWLCQSCDTDHSCSLGSIPGPGTVHRLLVQPKERRNIVPLATTWMDLGRMMLSKINQTEKDKHRVVWFHAYVESEKQNE